MQVYRHLLYNFLPAPHLGYTAWALARVCIFLVLLEVLGRQYAYSATLGAGRLEGLRRIESANITSHSPAMAMLPFNEPKFVLDTLTFTGNAFLEGTVFAVATMLAAWILRHPRWRALRGPQIPSPIPTPTVPAKNTAGTSDSRERTASGESALVSDVDESHVAPLVVDLISLDWVASRSVAGLPNKLLPWNVRRSTRHASQAAAARGNASSAPMPASSPRERTADEAGLQRRRTAAAKAGIEDKAGDTSGDAAVPIPLEPRRVRMPTDSEGNATWQFMRSAVAAMILGSFGRLAAMLVVIWAYPPQFVSAIGAFVLVSHITSLSAALDVNQFTATVLVSVGLVARLAIRIALYSFDCAPDVPIF